MRHGLFYHLLWEESGNECSPRGSYPLALRQLTLIRAVGRALRLDGVLMVTREAGKTLKRGFFAVWLIVKEKIHL